MQVANDVTSANELPRREARPGRRVNNSAAAGKLQGGELREDCVEALWSVVSLAAGPLARWPPCSPRWTTRRVQPVHRGEQGGQHHGAPGGQGRRNAAGLICHERRAWPARPQSALDAILAELAACSFPAAAELLTRRPGRASTTWELVRK